MTTDRYTPPKAELRTESNGPDEPKVPGPILQKIRNAWIACLISLAMTLLLTAIGMVGGSANGSNAWQLIDVALIAGLAFGIYRKSRACAVGMFIYFLVSKVLIIMERGAGGGLILGVVFLYFYWQGISGTFAYYRHLKS